MRHHRVEPDVRAAASENNSSSADEKLASTPSEKHASSRSERKDAVESRCRILNVARRLFRERNADAVSMHQIAKSAGVGQGTLYRHYAHKGELCLELLHEAIDDSMQQMESWLSESRVQLTNIELLEQVIVRIVDFTDDHVGLLTVISNTRCPDGTPLPFRSEYFVKLHETVSSLVERIVSERNIPALDVDLTADAILSALSPKVYIFERTCRGYSKQQFIDGILRIFVGGLFGGR